MPLIAQPDGSLRFAFFGVAFTWTLADGGNTLHGERVQSGITAIVDMHRCQPPGG
jgi:hypothetical protein